jgi:flavin-binding protein dodecin
VIFITLDETKKQPIPRKESAMSMIKVIEVHSEGTSLEGAVEAAVREASKTVEDIRSVYVQDIQALVEGQNIAKYRINAKISFLLRSR